MKPRRGQTHTPTGSRTADIKTLACFIDNNCVGPHQPLNQGASNDNALGLRCSTQALGCCPRAFSSYMSGCCSPLRCMGFSLWWLLLLPSTGSRHTGSVVLAGGLSCPLACGILVPRTEIEPMSPAWVGRFLTTGLPGKSPKFNNY